MGGRSSNSWIVSKGIYGCDGSPTLRFLLVRLFLFFSLSCGMILIPGPPPCSGPPPAASRKGRPRKEKTKHFFFQDIKSLVSKTKHFFSLLSTFLFFSLELFSFLFFSFQFFSFLLLFLLFSRFKKARRRRDRAWPAAGESPPQAPGCRGGALA